MDSVEISLNFLGCGLDELNWETVKDILRDVFRDTSVHMTVYIYEEKSKQEERPRTNNPRRGRNAAKS